MRNRPVGPVSAPDKILEGALGLSAEARADLALRLVESLEDVVDDDADEAWATEVTRRLRAYDAGQVEARPAEDVLAEIRARLTHLRGQIPCASGA